MSLRPNKAGRLCVPRASRERHLAPIRRAPASVAPPSTSRPTEARGSAEGPQVPNTAPPTAPPTAKPRYIPLVFSARTAACEPPARGTSHACIGGLTDQMPIAHPAVIAASAANGTEPGAIVFAMTASTAKIGRASCREEVAQDGVG